MCYERHTHTHPVKLVQSALGKAARIGYVVPESSPFIASLWAAYAAGRKQAELEAHQALPNTGCRYDDLRLQLNGVAPC